MIRRPPSSALCPCTALFRSLAAVLHAVAVAVVPDEVADGDRLIEAEVDRQITAAPGQGARRGAAGAGVAVGGAGPLPGRRGRVAGRWRDRDGVGPRRLG